MLRLAARSELQGELKLQHLLSASGLGLAAGRTGEQTADDLAWQREAVEKTPRGPEDLVDPLTSHNALQPHSAAPVLPFLLRRRQIRFAGAGRVPRVPPLSGSVAGSRDHPSILSALVVRHPYPRFPVAHTPLAVTVYWQPRGAKAPRGRRLGRDMQRTGSPGGRSGVSRSRTPL